jgi:hypothetical protein
LAREKGAIPVAPFIRRIRLDSLRTSRGPCRAPGHVGRVDAGHGHRLLHRVAAERLAQFLVDHRLDQRGLAVLIWSLIAWFSASVSSSIVRATTPFSPQAWRCRHS